MDGTVTPDGRRNKTMPWDECGGDVINIGGRLAEHHDVVVSAWVN